MSRIATSISKSYQRLQRQLWQGGQLSSMISSINHEKRLFSTTTKETNDQENETDKANETSNDQQQQTTDEKGNELEKADGDKTKLPNRIFVASPSTVAEREVYVESVVPKQIVENLDRYIIGQSKAKRAVAVSLRNRWRRSQLEEKLRKEVMPMNILMMGPTGTGKTEIARRLAEMVDAPFVKVEATKYTEVGIVGQSAEECIKDLIERSVKMEKQKRVEKLKEEIEEKVEKHILSRIPGSTSDPDKFKKLLREGHFDNTKIEVASFRLDPPSPFPFFGGKGPISILSIPTRSSPSHQTEADKKKDRVPISEAREIIKEFELSKNIDETDIRRTGIRRAEESGIIFLDEIDKLCSDSGSYRGDYKGVKGEGVQKELLGLIEGTSVQTDYGIVQTDHMLFVCAGAFHQSSPSDLLPELQGRLPIRVELEALTEDDFYYILTATEANLILQQQALFASEGVDLEFSDEALRKIAKISRDLNDNVENIGARRLRAVISKIVENLSFDADEKRGEKVLVTDEFVDTELKGIVKNEDLSRYIL